MFPIRFKRPALLCMAMLTVVLSGCGADSESGG